MASCRNNNGVIGYTEIVAAQRKSQIAEEVQRTINRWMNLLDRKVNVLQMDRGGEFISNTLTTWAGGHSPTHVMYPDTTQNGAAEHANPQKQGLYLGEHGQPFGSSTSWALCVVYAAYQSTFWPVNGRAKVPAIASWGRMAHVCYLLRFGCLSLCSP